MAEAEQREIVWTRSAREDLKKIYEFVSSLQGEVFINRIFDSRQNPSKLDL